MNAVARLAGDMNRLEAASRKQFEPFFSEAAAIQDIIRAVIETCLGRKDDLPGTAAPLFDYPLIPGEEEHGERPDYQAPPASSAENTINITLSSLQMNSLAGTLGEAFFGFASQTAALAGIYSPSRAPEDLPGPVAARPDTGSVPEILGRSASVIHSLESVRMDMTRTLFFQGPAIDGIPLPGPGLQPGPLPPYSRGGDLLPVSAPALPSRETGLPPVSAPSGISRAGYGRTGRYPEPLDAMFTPLHGMLQESGKMAGIPLPVMVPEGHLPLLQATGPATGITGPEYPVTVHRQAGAPALPAEARRLPGAAAFLEERKKPSRGTAERPRPAPGTGIIEIPSLVPKAAKNLPPGMAAMNAERFQEGLARLSGSETAQTVLPLSPGGVLPAGARLPRDTDLSSPAVSVPAAFEKIAQFITSGSAVCQQLMAPVSGGIAAGGPGTFSIPLPFTMGEGGGGDFAGITLQGTGIHPAENTPVMNVAVSMLAGDVMQRAVRLPFSAAESLRAPGMSPAGALPGAVPLPPLYSLEHALPLYAGSRGETAPPAAGTGNPVNFQNTFNITVTTTGRGDETEMRELGRKIGAILSDELRRYGGLR